MVSATIRNPARNRPGRRPALIRAMHSHRKPDTPVLHKDLCNKRSSTLWAIRRLQAKCRAPVRLSTPIMPEPRQEDRPRHRVKTQDFIQLRSMARPSPILEPDTNNDHTRVDNRNKLQLASRISIMMMMIFMMIMRMNRDDGHMLPSWRRSFLSA